MMAWTWPAHKIEPSLVLVATPTDGTGGDYTDSIEAVTIEAEYLNVSTEERSSRHELHAADATLLPS